MPSFPRLIAHVDMDAFFASIEALDHPEWKNEPIVVCVFSGRTAESGVVSSSSYDVREMGVKAGMPIVQAKQKCPFAHFVSVRHERYSQLSEEVFIRLFPIADGVEIASIDEAYADLTQKSKGDYSSAEKLLHSFQSELKREVGLSCSVGLGPNKLVAKMASDFIKPGGFTVVLPENTQSFLDPLPVKNLLGVGPKTQGELEGLHISTILDLRCASLNELVKVFGSVKGHYLFFSSRGMDESPIESNRERKQHSKIWTLKQDTHSWTEIKPLVAQNAEELWNETVGKGLFFTQIGVIGISASLIQTGKSKTFSLPISTREGFMQGLEELFLELFESNPWPWRRVGIRVSGFVSPPKQKRLGDF
jgi:DNA polymerase IV (DinB-like DNA polymerase)